MVEEQEKPKYTITPYTLKRAKMLGVKVETSDKPRYKLKVITKDGQIIYCGAVGYGDFPTYVQTHGLEYARKRQALYKKRHENDRHKPNTPGFMADNLLW